MEEAGLEISPESLLCIEECGGRWIRFTFTGKHNCPLFSNFMQVV